NKKPFENLENINLHRDGRVVVLETNGFPIYNEDGQFIGYRGVDRDITQRKKTERRTYLQQAELDSVFRASPVGVAVSVKRRLIRGNKRFYEITGYSEKELLEMEARQIYQTDQEYKKVGAQYTEAMINGTARIETQLIRKDQSVIDVVINIAPLDMKDEDAGFVVILQDVTESIQSRQRYRNTIESSPMGILTYQLTADDQLVLTGSNPAVNAILGVDITAFVGKTIEEVFPELAHTSLPEDYRRICKEGGFCHGDDFAYQDERVSGLYEFTAFQTSPGEMATMFLDVTDRMQNQQKLRDSEAALRKAQQIARLGFYDWDLQNNTITASDGLKSFFGCKPDEQLTFEHVVESIHPDDRKQFVEADFESRTKGVPFSMDYRVVLPSGKIRWAHDQSEVTVDKQGNKVRMFGIIQDITQRMQTQQKLRDSEAELQKAQKIGKIGNYEFDLKTQIFSGTGEIRKIYNLTEDEEVTLEKLLAKVVPEDRPLIKQAIEQSIAKDWITLEHRIIAPDGSTRWIHSEGGRLLDEQGQATKLYGISQDISERKQSELKLKQAHSELSQVFENAMVGIFRTDFSGKILLVNPAILRIMGYDSMEAMNEVGLPNIYKNPSERDKLMKRVAQGPVEGFETQVVRSDGKIIDIILTIYPVLEADGQVSFLEGNLIDITERKQAEQRLQENEAYLSSLIRLAPTGICVMKGDVYVSVNDRFCENTGYSRDELIGEANRQVNRKLYESDAEYEAVSQKIYEQISDDGIVNLETRIIRKDGTLIHNIVSGIPLDPDNLDKGILFAGLDITDRKVAEQQREVLMEQIQNRNDELQSIVFTAAHDLRSPLVNIAGFTGELEKGLTQLAEALNGAPLDADIAERIDFLLKTDLAESLRLVKFGNQQMDMLLGGLMRVSRVGTAALKLITLDMNEMFAKVIRGFQYQINTLGVDVSVQDDLPDCIGDYSLLAQVFINLLDNAIKYRHPQRELVIEIGGTLRGETVEYTIADNGIGIEPEHTEKVFDLFCQLERRQAGGGEGLGLTIVRRILDRQHGSARIDSTPGLGTTVHIRMPGP
ncbi:MAG: PAS domain-containing sensor histidine kinase, partial [Planctomycetota bacterium]